MHYDDIITGKEFKNRFCHSVNLDNIILNATLELTTKCCLNCVHCCCVPPSSPELNTAEWKNIIDRLEKAGCFIVLVTGGEPLLRKDFPEIYLHLKKKGMIITVFSNGVLINDEIIQLFKEWPPLEIEISIYGSNKEVFGLVTGHPEKWGTFRANLDSLKEAGVPFNLKTMILKENCDDNQAIYTIAKEYGVRFRNDPLVMPRTNGDYSSTNSRATPKIAAEKTLAVYKQKEIYDMLKDRRQRYKSSKVSKRLFRCMVEEGTTSIFITSTGYLAPCHGLSPWGVQEKKYPVLNDYKKDFWDKLRLQPFINKKSVEKCWECDYYYYCAYCLPSYQSNKPGFKHPDPYICSVQREIMKLAVSKVS